MNDATTWSDILFLNYQARQLLNELNVVEVSEYESSTRGLKGCISDVLAPPPPVSAKNEFAYIK